MNPSWEEWHCYAAPLRIYSHDYELLLVYFNKIYPIRDAFDGSVEETFDVCFDNWIEKEDWDKIIFEIEEDIENISDVEKPFFQAFLQWLKEALENTRIIVVEGNL